MKIHWACSNMGHFSVLSRLCRPASTNEWLIDLSRTRRDKRTNRQWKGRRCWNTDEHADIDHSLGFSLLEGSTLSLSSSTLLLYMVMQGFFQNKLKNLRFYRHNNSTHNNVAISGKTSCQVNTSQLYCSVTKVLFSYKDCSDRWKLITQRGEERRAEEVAGGSGVQGWLIGVCDYTGCCLQELGNNRPGSTAHHRREERVRR